MEQEHSQDALIQEEFSLLLGDGDVKIETSSG